MLVFSDFFCYLVPLDPVFYDHLWYHNPRIERPYDLLKLEAQLMNELFALNNDLEFETLIRVHSSEEIIEI